MCSYSPQAQAMQCLAGLTMFLHARNEQGIPAVLCHDGLWSAVNRGLHSQDSELQEAAHEILALLDNMQEQVQVSLYSHLAELVHRRVQQHNARAHAKLQAGAEAEAGAEAKRAGKTQKGDTGSGSGSGSGSSAAAGDATAGQAGDVVCANCGKSASREQLMMCTGCRRARYCAKACQKEHWKVHKPSCLAVRAEQAAAADS
jgi:hypothetical protein